MDCWRTTMIFYDSLSQLWLIQRRTTFVAFTGPIHYDLGSTAFKRPKIRIQCHCVAPYVANSTYEEHVILSSICTLKPHHDELCTHRHDTGLSSGPTYHRRIMTVLDLCDHHQRIHWDKREADIPSPSLAHPSHVTRAAS